MVLLSCMEYSPWKQANTWKPNYLKNSGSARKMSAELRLLILDHRGNKINEGMKMKERISEWVNKQTKGGHLTQASSLILL